MDLDFVLMMALSALKAICVVILFFLVDIILLIIYYRCI